MGAERKPPSRYDRIASLYDCLASLYSGGAIARAKRAHLARLKPGQTVLYVGAGTGAECIDAARHEARVTVCDTSPRMVELARARFRSSGLSAEFWCKDALSRPVGAHFDVVVAPFFLNVLAERDVPSAIMRLSDYLLSGGLLVSVDFRRPSCSWFSTLQRIHYLPPLVLFAALMKNPFHDLYDYVKLSAQARDCLPFRESLITRAWGLPLYETLIWEKV